MKACVLLSGGLDSTVTLAKAIEDCGRDNVIALSMFYGQRHEKELEAGKQIAEHYGIQRIVLDVSNVFAFSDSAMLKDGKKVEEGSYEQQLLHHKEPTTVVPFRNGVFLSIAASIAEANGCGAIYCGIHAGDAQANYFDCREDFFSWMFMAIKVGTGDKVTINAPFVNLKKVDVVREGVRLHAPLELTWSCYKGRVLPCGKCATCIERAEAFRDAGFIDPANGTQALLQFNEQLHTHDVQEHGDWVEQATESEEDGKDKE